MKYLITSTFAILMSLGMAASATCEFDIVVQDNMLFSTNQIEAESSCESITVNIQHVGSMPRAAMGHNWVLVETKDMEAIANDGMAAGLDNDYIKPDDSRVIAHTKIVGGGESDSISFSPSGMSPDGDYSFFCSFPGHWYAMKGSFLLN